MFVSDLGHHETPAGRTRAWFHDLVRAPLRPAGAAGAGTAAAEASAPGVRTGGLAALYLAIYGAATMLAAPLASLGAPSPEFPIAITASGTRSVTVLAHGPDVGWHLLRVPGVASNTDAQRMPARLAGARLTLISLNGGALTLRTTGPFGQAVALEAEGRTLTIYRTPERTGVRSGW